MEVSGDVLDLFSDQHEEVWTKVFDSMYVQRLQFQLWIVVGVSIPYCFSELVLHMNGYTTGHEIEMILLVEAIHQFFCKNQHKKNKCKSGEGTQTTIMIKNGPNSFLCMVQSFHFPFLVFDE